MEQCHALFDKIGINLNFGSKLCLFKSSDSYHKKMLLESLNIPLYLGHIDHLLCLVELSSCLFFVCNHIPHFLFHFRLLYFISNGLLDKITLHHYTM